MSAEERKDHYKKHNHRMHHEHHREAARKMDTRKMQVGRHPHTASAGSRESRATRMTED